MAVRTIITVGLAGICGLSAAFGVNQLRPPPASADRPATSPVVVVKADVLRGRMVTAEMLELRDWPQALLPPNALTEIENAVDRAAVSPLLAGEPLLEGKLASRDSGRGLAALIPSGMRAYTIHTARVASNVAGFILPGNRVDVLMSLRTNANDETGGGSTTTLLQAVEILAIDQRLDAPAENMVDPNDLGSVTLLVTPEQASLLDLGQSAGTLTLSLRNPEDREPHAAKPATLAAIRFRQEQPLDEAAADTPLPLLRTTAKVPVGEQRPSVVEIRTFRAQHAGSVQVRVP